jgi:membrane protease YdiL (CAAX protease family)
VSPLVRSSAIGYSVLLIVSLGVAFAQGRAGEIFGFPGWGTFGARMGTGVLMAALVLAGSRALRETFLWARLLEEEFRRHLAPLSAGDALILAVASGFVEELFFRATLQPVLGLWMTSIGFGLLHYPINRRMIPWTVMAALLGLLFGLVYERTGSLLAVALAHAVVNYVELGRIARAGPGPSRA